MGGQSPQWGNSNGASVAPGKLFLPVDELMVTFDIHLSGEQRLLVEQARLVQGGLCVKAVLDVAADSEQPEHAAVLVRAALRALDQVLRVGVPQLSKEVA